MFKTNDGIKVHTRADWGARLPAGPYARQPGITTVVYHHGGDEGKPRMTDSAMAATVRSWQGFHMGPFRQWTDIGYHLLMDGRGELWQGRPTWAVGAHVLQQNTGRLGLCYVQDGREHGFTKGQEETTRKLFKWKHNKMAFPSLEDVSVLGHREVPGQATECPGAAITADMKRLIREFS